MNRPIKIIITIILLTACDEVRMSGGLGYTNHNYNHENWQHESPVGKIELEANKYLNDNFYIGGFCEHVSAFNVKDTPGLNYCGPHGGFQWGGRP